MPRAKNFIKRNVKNKHIRDKKKISASIIDMKNNFNNI